ncbi:MAG: TetR/AcrR family transcriptional regulator [Candidatus Dormibacteraeota bacterium]|uniref:TetR/AcrR family transcriptional regulator n=1 Tax=Candidatus Dormiibacter inghamiae TaxID=3127013 RepID=A0A934KE81_9BACT|nr:TetR/AcrR family transcriptional regulator [Candidatus Dormibacteraeota bacterium]MBJ7606259.1 TetR/AcrR family transcriptional regulator [Candidatus Dormibacteraeota bacterium]
MDPISAAVKTGRRYDASRRQRQALLNREAVLEAARRLFLADGYGPTTIAAIAAAADVSVETVYKGFGGKPGLVRAIWSRGLAGSGPVPAWERSDEMQSLEADPRRVILNWGRFMIEVAPAVAPVLLLIRDAAAADAEMAALLQEVDQARLVRMEENARRLHGRGGFREDIGLEQATDVLWTYSSPELYELLVLRRSWPLDSYGRFVADAMIAALLPASGSA